ncbi:MAG: MazG-like family protein [Thermoplasmatota archaeon]
MVSDKETVVSELREMVRDFISERDWDQYHRSKDVAAALSIEASELLELYLWDRSPEREELEDELADILFFVLDMGIREDIDLSEALRNKISKNAKKYPRDLVKGRDDKYTKYDRGERS